MSYKLDEQQEAIKINAIENQQNAASKEPSETAADFAAINEFTTNSALITSDLSNGKDAKSKIKPWAKFSFGIAIMIAVLVLTWHIIFRDYKFSDMVESLLAADYRWLALGFLMMLIHQLCIAISIYRMLKFIAPNVHLSFKEAFNTSFIGFFFNNITPSSSGGQPMQMLYLKKLGLPISYTSLIFMTLAVFYNGALLFYCLLVHFFRYDYVVNNLGFVAYLLPFGYILYIVSTTFLILVLYNPKVIVKVLRWTLGFLLKKRLIRKPKRLVKKLTAFSNRYLASSMMLGKRWRLLGELTILHLVQIAAYTTVPFFICQAMVNSTSNKWQLFVDSFTMQAVLNISASLVPSPGAVGLTEGSFVQLFGNIVGEKQVVTTMLLTRIANLYVVLLISALITIICFAKLGLKITANNLDANIETDNKE